MQVLVTVVDGNPGDADDLLSWLRKDPAGAQAQPSLTGGSAEQMGAGEVVQGSIDTALALGGFLLAAGTWLDARRDRAVERRQLRIERNGNSKAVTIDGASPEQIERALRELLDSGEGDEGE